MLIAVSTCLTSELVSANDTNDIEFISICVKLNKSKIFITCSYIPPSSPQIIYEKHANAIKMVSKLADKNDIVIAFGDFNLPSVSWTYLTDENYFVQTKSNCHCDDFFKILYNCNLLQINGIYNKNYKLLDLIFINDVSNYSLSRSLPLTLPEDSHHPTIEMKIQIQPQNSDSTSLRYETAFYFKDTNYGMLNNLLNNTNWIKTLSNSTNIIQMCELFYNKMYEILNLCVPKRIIKPRSGPPWKNRSLTYAKNIKNKWYKKFKNSGSNYDYLNYSISRAKYTSLNSYCYANYLYKIKKNFKRDPQSFYKFVNSKRKTIGFPSTMKLHQNESSNDNVICNLFADFFSTTYSDTLYDDSVPYPFKIDTNQLISIQFIDQETVCIELKKIKFSYQYGPDLIPSCILNKYAEILCTPLTLLFNKSLEAGYFPEVWKDSYIIPLHKSGSKSDITNYRGIAKLSVIPKLFEKIITEQLCFQVENIITPYQHGFRKKCSTITNLLQLTTVVNRALLEQKQTDVIYTDFSKAFDKVNHKLLKTKLHLIGFTDRSLNWLYSYLTNRKQTVRFKNACCRHIEVLSGVPQGSHLGPILFSRFVNDMPQTIEYSNILMYADDVKLFLSYSDINNHHMLQRDLNSFFRWCSLNLMTLNLAKCKYMRFVRRNPLIVNYTINDYQLVRVDTFLDLGILLDSKLNFISHVTATVNKARGVLGFVKRWSKEFNDPYVTKSLYMSLVRPILEYGSVIWDPIYLKYSDFIESVQKQFLIFCLRSLRFNPLNMPPYTARLALIKLPTLKSRRTMLNVSFLHGIILGNINSGGLLSNLNFSVPQRTTRHYIPLMVQFYRVNYANADPLRRMCNNFNTLYPIIDYSTNIDIIKSKILIFLNS